MDRQADTSWGGGWCALSNMIQHIFNLKACCTKIFIKKMQTPFHQRFFSSTFYDLKYYWLTVQNNSRSKITKTKQQKQSSCPQRFVFLLDFLKDIHCVSHGRVDHYERVFCEFWITVVEAKMILLFCFVFAKTDKITSRNAAKAFPTLFNSFFSAQFLFVFNRHLWHARQRLLPFLRVF